MSDQSDPTFDHGEGLGDDDGAPSQGRGPMPLLGVVAFQGDRLALALGMAANCQHQRIDDIGVGAEQAHLPAGEAFEQTPKGSFVTVAALPVNQPARRAVVGLPDLVRLALQIVPHLIAFDYHRLAERRLGAAAIDRAAHPAQYRLRRGAEQVGDGVERQTLAVQADRGASGRFGRAVDFRASKLVAAPFAAPPLLAYDEPETDDAATTAPGTARKIGYHQDFETVNSSRLSKIRH